MGDLKDIKVGDLLAIGGRMGAPVIARVERLTKTQAITERGRRFRLDNAREVGSSGYWTVYARKATEADLMARRVETLQWRLSKFKVTPENVEQVEALLKEAA